MSMRGVRRMKKRIYVVFFISIIYLALCNRNLVFAATVVESSAYEITMKRDLLCFMMAYPEYVIGIERKEDKVFLVMKSGARILYDDKRGKSFEQKLANPDLQDTMEQHYPLTDIKTLMTENFSPGRVRSYELLKEVYGSTKGEVQGNIKGFNTNCGKISFNKNNKAGEALKGVMSELSLLAKSNGKVSAAVFPMSGTFNYRCIAGTNRLSPHSFGTAIDLARDRRDYWKWASKEQGEARLKEYPSEVVRCFEKYNFIWGGKWAHFDILHFEYRPELVIKARYYEENNNEGSTWYKGVPFEEKNVKKLINIIETAVN